MSQVVAGFDLGFDAFDLIEPNVITDINGDYAISTINAFLIVDNYYQISRNTPPSKTPCLVQREVF